MADFDASPPTPPGTGSFSSDYGYRGGTHGAFDLHTAIDIWGPEQTPVFAVLPGRVRAFPSGQLHQYGNTIVIEHGPTLYSLYAHLYSLEARTGDQVVAGQMVGTMGRTFGTKQYPDRVYASGKSHLHFEFLDRWPPRGRDQDRLDPVPMLRQLGIVLQLRRPLLVIAGSHAAPFTDRLIAQKMAPANSIIQPDQVPPLREPKGRSDQLLSLLAPSHRPTYAVKLKADSRYRSDGSISLILLAFLIMRRQERQREN